MIGDTDFNVSKLYDMLPASTSGDPLTRTPADNQTVRNVFIIGPDKKIKLVLVYPMTTGRNFAEILRVDRLPADDGQASRRDAGRLETGRGRHHRGLRQRRRRRRRSIRPAGRRRSRTSGSCRSRSDGERRAFVGWAKAHLRVPTIASDASSGGARCALPAPYDSPLRHQPIRHEQSGGRRDRRHERAPGDVDDRDRPAPMREQRQRGQVEGRVAKQAEQRAIEQRRLPGTPCPPLTKITVPPT